MPRFKKWKKKSHGTNTKYTMKDRLIWIDLLKLLAIFLVILGHVIITFHPLNEGPYDRILLIYIYSFHMPLFMFISGYLSRKIKNGIYDIKGRFYQLIVPTVSCYFLFYILGYSQHNLWFLPCLFMCYFLTSCIYYLLNCISKNSIINNVVIVCVLFLCISVFNKIPIINKYKLDFMLPFFIVGVNYDITRKYSRYITIIILLITILFLLFWNKQYIYYFSKTDYINYHLLFDLNKNFLVIDNLIKVLYRFFTGYFVSISFFIIFSSLKLKSIVFQKLSKFGLYTLQIYIVQTLVLEHNFFNFHFRDNYPCYYNIFITPFISICVLIICLLIIKTVEKNRIIDILFFGNRKKY